MVCSAISVSEMTWTYSQSTGDLMLDGDFQTRGYSGTGHGRNNPDMQDVQGVGPIPQGTYQIGQAYDHPHLGLCVMNLEPRSGTNTFGRSLFRIHGNNAENDASHGCIVIEPATRRLIAASADTQLRVTL